MDPRSQPSPQRHDPPTTRGSVNSVSVPSRDSSREAALNVVRGEIDNIYSGNADAKTPHTTSIELAKTAAPAPGSAKQQPQKTISQSDDQQLVTKSPYDRTHTAPELSSSDQWKRYHSAWQQYYQKYYEQYYVKAVSNASVAQGSAPKQQDSIDTNSHTEASSGEGLTKDQALYELRQSIINKAQKQAKKVRKSRHFIPLASAFAVLLVFAFLQYNQIMIANVKAYVSPGAIAPENIIVDPNSDVPVGPDTKMIIPKINVDAPIVMGVGPTNEDQLKAMANGIAHVKYPGAASDPGQAGNAVFSAHSSSDWTDSGDYKFIFVQLERMAKDDIIYINYQSKRYTYKVYDIKVVAPDDVASLNYTGSDPILTLITCTPLGTAQKRLLVFAKQVSPNPNNAAKPAAAPPQAQTQQKSSMVGTAPTLIERLFGAS